MATKAGRAEISDIRAGKTLWMAVPDQTGKRHPVPLRIWKGPWLAPRGDHWVYGCTYLGQDRFEGLGDHTHPLNHKGEPCLDKIFINRSAAVRWIKRFESNRIETLCEDRRVFKYGSHFMRRSGIDLANLANNKFVSTEQWLVTEAKYERHPKQPFNLFEATAAAQKALAEAQPG